MIRLPLNVVVAGVSYQPSIVDDGSSINVVVAGVSYQPVNDVVVLSLPLNVVRCR